MEAHALPESVTAPPQRRELAPDHPLRTMDLSTTGLKIVNEYDQIMNTFDQHDTIIVSVGTGGGKTIGLPLMLLKHKPDSRITITQPRNAPMKRISSRTAELAKDSVGDLIGVRYKGSGAQWSDKTQVMYEMEQTLLNELDEDPKLKKYNIAMVDEQHEAGGRTQFLLQRLLDAQKLRADEGLEPLKIVIASATIDTNALKEQLADQLVHQRKGQQIEKEALKKTIGIVEVEGATPKEIKKVYADREYSPDEMPAEAAKMAKNIIDANENPGDILIFLAGLPEIRNTKRVLESLGVTDDAYDIHILSSGTTEDQKDAIASKAPGGKRKIILSTNSGETGMTFHKDLYYMIDTGLIKQTMVDKDTGMEYLATVEHTWSGCMQRDGRLGRVGTGEARHLYTEKNLQLREQINKYPMPEIQRSNLIPYMLELLRIGKTDVRNFHFLDQPDQHIITMAMNSLKTLGAIDEQEQLTPIGREMATMGIDPHLARMVIEGKKQGCARTMATVAVLMDNAEAIMPRKEQAVLIHRGSDPLTLLRVYQEYQSQPSNELREAFALRLNISPRIFETITSKSKEIAAGAPPDTSQDNDTIGRCIAAGFKDQIVEQTASGVFKPLLNPDAQPLRMDPYSHAQFPTEKHLMFGGIRKDRNGQTLMQLCHELKREWIEDMLPKEAIPAKPEEVIREKTPPPPVARPVSTAPISPIPADRQIHTNGHHAPSEAPRNEAPVPKGLWDRAKQIAHTISAPVRWVWRVLMHLFGR